MPEREPGAPRQIDPRSLADYLEAMSKSVFQAGMSWEVVESKWPGIREALHGFDPAELAALDGAGVDALMEDRRVIRNRRKLEAIASNAARMLELDAEHGSFASYLRAHGDYAATERALRHDFSFLGEHGTYVFLYTVREPVPPYHEWNEGRRRPTHHEPGGRRAGRGH